MQSLHRLIVSGVFVVCLASPLTPQAAESAAPVTFQHLTVADGLSESSPTAITQDAQGFMWFATQNGLNKYDAYDFIVYRHDPDNANSLSSNNLRTLALGQGDVLWVGSIDAGLSRLELRTQKVTRYRHNPADPNSLSHDAIQTVFEDEAGLVWVGTQNGLNRLDPASGQITRWLHEPAAVNGLAHPSVTDLAAAPAGQIWVGTQMGLQRLDPASGQFVTYRHDPANPHSLSDNAILTLLPGPAGTLWIGTDTGGLNHFDPAHETFKHYALEPSAASAVAPAAAGPGQLAIASLASDQHYLWIGTTGGLFQLNLANDQMVAYRHDANDPTSLNGDRVTSLFLDETGTLWAGLVAVGISRYDPARNKFPPAIPVQPFAIGLTQTPDGAVWTSPFGQGLTRIDPRTGARTTFTHNPNAPTSLSHDLVFVLYTDRAGDLWAGTLNGLNRFNPATHTFERFLHVADDSPTISFSNVWALAEDAAGFLWVGTRGGLVRLDPATGQVVEYDPPPASNVENWVTALYASPEGGLWVGRNNRLERWALSNGQVQRYEHDPANSQSVSAGRIVALHPATNGGLWLGFYGSGLDYFNPQTETFRHYRLDDGLADEAVLGILADADHRLWLSTGKGLSRFDPATEEFRNYDVRDGLPGTDFTQNTAFQNAAGELFFGGLNGLTIFRPEQIADNPHRPAVVLTGFQLFNQPVPIGGDSPLQTQPSFVQDLTLRHDQSVFSFEFAALNYTNAEKNNYAYKLEGFDQQWNEVGQRRFATYTNLNPGTYTFRVRATNNDGVWNEEGLAIRLTVTPPWWQTWWAYTLYGLVGVSAVVGYTYYQERQLRRERRLRALLLQIDQHKDEDRARIAREMHDGLAQTLAGLRLRVNVWQTFLANNPTRLEAEFAELRGVLDGSIQDIRRVIYDLRPVVLEELGFLPALEGLLDGLTEKHGLTLHRDLAAGLDALPLDLENALYRLVQELLNNIVRHAQAQNVWLTIEFNTERMPERVMVRVRDDGQGFDLATLDALARAGHLGLRQLRERVELLQGRFTLRTTLGQGTEVEVELPVFRNL